MNRMLAVITSAFLLCYPFLAAAQSDVRDGNWWRNQSAHLKNSYIIGFFDGTHLGYRFAIWKPEGGINDHAEEAQKSFDHYTNKYLARMSNDQIAEGLDNFYGDYRNRSIRLSAAVWLVTNEIAGTPRAELDKMIENWRRSAR